ncbi:DUF4129 domain-containing protein [Mucilaginibacter robiniae]|uniref:DUF4129 domain-containing protein n=1 Tax=Mucilaginibacter robiniae TaxID=2728022 RepID=A0A7L5E2G4_9SPHI|nr:DUF4129 domain-containing protein [Mucilaginibacter robiniae]QJD96748.1 DUF4129 domain-containing protein [Mucilaginibacter robiniae]
MAPCSYAANTKTNKTKPNAPAHLRTDSSTLVQQRSFDNAYLNQLKQQPDFQYHETQSSPSLWTRFWRWFWSLFDDWKVSRSTGPLMVNVFKYLFILIGASALTFLILRIAGVDLLKILKRKPADATLPYAETLENIHEIDFDTGLEQAISQRNYRLAVRLLYLKALKQLSDQHLIHWQINKTNSAYVDELKNLEQRETFTILTRQFEYVWYGEFAINEQAFQNISILFTNFKQTLA